MKKLLLLLVISFMGISFLKAQTATITSINVSCFGGNNGSIDIINASGGTAPYEYSINGKASWQSNGSFMNLIAGNYNIWIRDALFSEVQLDPAFQITEPMELSAFANPIPPICPGGMGSIEIQSPFGGSGMFEYSIDGTTWQSLTMFNNVLINNPYQVYIRDFNVPSCSKIINSNLIVNNTPPISANVNVINVNCFGGNDGSISITGSNGGTPPYNYSINGGSSWFGNAVFSNLPAGTYQVMIKDINNCQVSLGTHQVISNSHIISTGEIITESCSNQATGTINLSNVSGGVPPYNYTWSNLMNGSYLEGLNSGTYSVTITDNTGCFITRNFNVNQLTPFSINVNTLNVTCAGLNNGTASANVSGGTPTYLYNWGPNQFEQTIDSLAPGNYVVWVTDSGGNGCSFSQTFSIYEPSAIQVNKYINHITCAGQNNGSVDLNIYGGNLPYTFLWSSGATTEDVYNLAYGKYYFTVTDANNCQHTDSVEIFNASALSINFNPHSPTCANSNNGWIEAFVNGGSSPYSYSWSYGANNSNNIYNLPGGSYSLTVTDNAGCSAFNSVNLYAPSAVNFSIYSTNSTCAQSDGSAWVVVSGGNSNYTFSWSNSSTNDTIGNISSGLYYVTVSDTSDCSASQSISINDVGGPVAFISYNVNVSCNGGNNGAAAVSVTSGVPPFTYLWMPWGYTNDTILNLNAGLYTVTVTDINGCRGIIQTEIFQPGILDADIFKGNVSCNGMNDGGIMVSNVRGGIPPYSYLWSTGATVDSLSGLAPGTYQITITDYNNCTIVKSDSILNPPVLLLTLSTDSTCPGSNNGSVFTNVSGGTPSYNYNWNIGYSGNNNLISINAGTYTVTVTDQQGCVKIDSAVVYSFPQMDTTLQITNPVCSEQSNGAINLEVTGGIAPYTYSWNNYPNNYSTQDLSNIPSGYYNLTITDAASCNLYGSINVSEPNKITLNPYNVNVSSCGLNDGIASVYVQNGIAPFTYNWGIYGVNDTVYNVGFGTYNVTVTDINGCTANTSVIINEPASFYLNVLSFQPKCFGSSDGSAKVTPSGGTAPYNYLWSNSATTDSIFNLSVGIYYVTVSDASGCNKVNEVLISQPDKLQLSNINMYNVSCNGLADGNISIYVSGATSPYTYNWSHDTLLNGNSANGIPAGSYTFTVTDANACFIDSTIIITQPPALVIDSVNVLNISCADLNNGQIKIFAHGGTGNLFYTIDDLYYNSFNEYTNLYAGNYTVRVKDNNYCLTSVQNITINAPQQLLFDSVIVSDISCFNGNNGIITAYVHGGLPPYKYSIDGINYFSNNQFSGLTPGNYTVSVRDSNNCIKNYNNTIYINNPSPVIANAGSDITICQGQNANLIATGGISYLWNNSATSYTISVSPSITTLYTVTVSDANGCTAVDSVTVNVNELPVANAGTDQSVCSNSSPDVILNGIITGATGGFWTSSGTGSFSNSNNLNTAYTLSSSDISAGSVTLTLSSTGGGVCSPVSDGLIVTISQTPTANAGADLTLCTGQSATLTATGGSNYSWSNGAITASTTVSPTITTTYYVTVTNANGCMNTDAVLVTINTLPIANAGSNQVICSGNTLFLNASGGNTYSWSGPSGFTSNIQNPSISNITLANAGTYTVTVTNTSTSCWADTFIVITVNSASTVPSSISASANPLCIGSSTNLNVIGGSLGTGANWYWYSGACGGTFEGNGPTITVSPVTNKTYYVRAEGTCNSTTCLPSILVYVDILPTANAGADAVVCDTNGYTLSASFSGSASYGMWTSNGTGVFDDSFSPTAVYTPSTNDVLSGTVTLSFTTDDPPDACPSAASDTMILTINQAVIVNAGANQITCTNNPNISLSGNVTNATGGLWTSSGTGSFSPSNTSLNATYIPSGADISSGNVTLTLTSTGNGACAPVNDIAVIGFVPTSTGTDSAIICQGNTFTFGTQTLSTSGVYNETFIAANGCDSVVTLTLTVNPVYNDSITATICNGNTYTLPDNSVVSVAGTYPVTLLNSTGCDSIIVTQLFVNPVNTDSITATICNGNTYTLPDNSVVTVAGIYPVTLQNNFGCDSTIVTQLFVNPVNTDSITATICDGNTYTLPDNSVVSAAGTYPVTLLNIFGCDSNIVTSLFINSVSTDSITATICDGNTYTLPDNSVVSAAGIYPVTLLNSTGCDSTIVTQLFVNPVSTDSITATICEGNTYTLPDNSLVSAAGTYPVTLLNTFGCDSIIVTQLFVNPVSTDSITATICEGNTYTLPDNSVVSAAGTYPVTLLNTFGCDSIIVTQLFVNPVSTDSITATICEGNTYTLPDNSVVSFSGEYPVILLSVAGCDSTIITFLTVNPIYHDTVNAAICQGDSYTLPDNSVVTTAGIYPFNNLTNLGCDSNLVVNLIVNQLPVINFTGLNSTYCKVDTFVLLMGNFSTNGLFSGDGIVGGNVFNPMNALIGNNTISYSYTDYNGCTNTYIQNTTVNANPELTANVIDANCGQNNGSATLDATGGIPPYTYSTGSNTLNNLNAGVLIVTVTDANLCSSSGYVAISNIGSPVVSVISQTDASCSVLCDGAALLDVTGGAEPYTFAWSNNETIQNPISLCPGENFVEVTDVLGCITSSFVTLNFNQPDPTIFGRIVYSGGGIDGQYAKLEIYSTSQHVGGGFDLMNADVQIGSDGSFIMANFPPDIYILKVILQGNNPAYVNLMNSYYTDTLTSFAWETADTIILGCGNLKEANIMMHEMYNAGTGSGYFSGSISYPGAGGSKNIKGVYITEGKLAGEPVPGAEIFVELEPDDEPIANTTTDTAGFYAFEELPQGNYSLKVEIPGFPMVSTYMVAVTPSDSIFDQLNFFVDTTSNSGNIDTTLVYVPNEDIPAFSVSVYPNPYKDYLNISYKISKTKEVSIEIFDIRGSKIETVNNGKQTEGEYNFRFNPKKYSLMPGTYFIQLRVDNTVYLKKVVMIE